MRNIGLHSYAAAVTFDQRYSSRALLAVCAGQPMFVFPISPLIADSSLPTSD
jgi:hypothetical protein